jgi:hypothetical protein
MGDAILHADNAAIINKVRANASLEYQSRIPAVTQANLSKTFATLQAYQPMWNEFMDVLVNRIALTLFNQNSFTNRLKPLKSGAMNCGGMIQEIGVNLLHAEAYDPNDTNVFGGEKADVEVNYHQINRRDKYKMRVNNDLLEEAFLNDGQLAAFVNNLLSLPQKSDEWNEYIIMRGLLKKYQEADGFFNYQVPNLGTSQDPEADGKKITELLREVYLDTKGFYRTKYNALGMQVAPEELILLGTPKFFAKLDVNVLAAAYHMDKADFLADRTIVVDDFEMPGTQCMFLDSEWYKCMDTKLKTTNMYNPSADEWTYYLHHWGVYSASRQRTCIRFSTDATTAVIGQARTVTGITAALDPTVDGNKVLAPGADVAFKVKVSYSDGSSDSNAYAIITTEDATAPTKLPANVVYPDTGTYVDRMGVLHVSDTAAFNNLTVTWVSTIDATKLASVKLTAANNAAAASYDGGARAMDDSASTPTKAKAVSRAKAVKAATEEK